jgi:hypothetical protein
MQAFDELAHTAARNTGAGRVLDHAEDQGAPTSLGRGIGVLIKTSDLKLVGVIQEIKTHGLSIAIKQPLKVGSSVSVEFGSECRNGEIISCRRTGSTYETCVVMEKAADRRLDERFPVTLEVRIVADSVGSKTNALVVDLSRQGMGLEIPTPLKLQETVAIETATNQAFGIVRNCQELPGGNYHAGVEIFHVIPKERVESSRKPSLLERLFPITSVWFP